MTSMTALHLNEDKTQICIIHRSQLGPLSRLLITDGSGLVADRVGHSLKYLGIHIWPDAYIYICKDVMDAYTECVAFLRSLDCGFVATISLYNVICASICSWVGSFVPPSKELLNLEYASLQRLTRGPRHTFSKSALFQLREFGFPVQFQSILANSTASRVRNGCSTITDLPNIARDYNNMLQDDDRLLLFDQQWFKNTCFYHIQEAIGNVSAAGFDIAHPQQRRISKFLLAAQPKFDFQEFWLRRIRRFVDLEFIARDHMFFAIQYIARNLKPCLLS